MSVAERLHERSIRSRRVARLASWIAPRVQPGERVLDIGSGDGAVRTALGVATFGVDVLPRDRGPRFTLFDGERLPFRDRAYDAAMLIDVLHHTNDPLPLLREAIRVARRVIVKDHLVKGFAARTTLRLMDRVGNARFGVALPSRYLDAAEWQQLFDRTGLVVRDRIDRLGLYPLPFGWIFDRHMHFLATLERR